MEKQRFTAQEGDRGRPCFVMDETTQVILKLRGKADLTRAEAVAKYLRENIEAVDLQLVRS